MKEDSSLELSLDWSVVLAYMASIQRHSDNDQLVAAPTLNTVGSAISRYYRGKSCYTLKSEISNFMGGQRRMIVDAKLNGR